MLRGSLIALVTPMAPSGDIDWDALAALVEWHIESRSDGLVSVGTTGESPTVDFAEHKKLMAFTVERAKKRIPVIGGTGANATREAIALTQAAKEVGCDGCLSVTPYYNKPTQEGLFLHYKAVADAVAIPQLLYNVPSRTCCDLQAATVLRLAKVPNIVGIKEATGDMSRAKELIEGRPPGFVVYSGDDATARELMLLGGDGSISVTANVMPVEYRRMCQAALDGDATSARAIDAKMEELHKVLFVEANPIPVKWALREMGRIGGAIRLPLTVLSEQRQPVVRAALERAGLLPKK
ncbi:MAG TPA: 4-hydroxy-tetrahydrodipicolinate synthase [Polyangiaceae bacterium]|jgi:4-hydroxy-tetrahydrodipicolinate synthase|nr:4-hydroxy-tetrahydrodipicolinate synthase [Polyangiaceae bacterium]